MGVTLGRSDQPLQERYDLAMLDLDGVVYVGSAAVAGAPEHVTRARAGGMRVAFVTNNASRTPAAVVAHLARLGVEASGDDVVTSAQAAARVLVDRLGPGAPVAVLGAAGLVEAVSDAGLRAVDVQDDRAQAVVTGYGPDVVWSEVMRAAVRIRDGLWWVASNTDLTIPTPFGAAPGHGVQVDMLRRFSGVDPVVAGKPAPPLLEETVRRCASERPLMVGDRLDTDIEGGRAVGVDTLLVLTGVTDLAVLVAARPEQRPTYLAVDLGGLAVAHPEPLVSGDEVQVGGWSARVVDGTLQVDGSGERDDWWRAAAVAAWRHLDATGEPASTAAATPPG